MNVVIDKFFWTRWRAVLVMAVVALALTFSQGTSLLPRKEPWWTSTPQVRRNLKRSRE